MIFNTNQTLENIVHNNFKKQSNSKKLGVFLKIFSIEKYLTTKQSLLCLKSQPFVFFLLPPAKYGGMASFF